MSQPTGYFHALSHGHWQSARFNRGIAHLNVLRLTISPLHSNPINVHNSALAPHEIVKVEQGA